jgi:hypothetical protein
MRAYARSFTLRRICTDLGVASGPERQRVRRALRDFERRGEIYHVNGTYRYNTKFRKGLKESPVRGRMLKAMYVSDRFCVRDIELLSHVDRNYINKVIRQLAAAGYLARLDKVAGNEWHYRITDRDKFRLEAM